MKYRKKPVVIEAIQFTKDNKKEIVEFCAGSIEGEDIIIYTREGNMRANNYDYIIRGIQGEYYPCKPDIFNATYELV